MCGLQKKKKKTLNCVENLVNTYNISGPRPSLIIYISKFQINKFNLILLQIPTKFIKIQELGSRKLT